MSPTQRTLALLKHLGYPAAVVERWNPHARIRQDLFGCIDILALSRSVTDPTRAYTWAIQVTSADHVAERQDKITENPHLATMLAAGWVILVQGWRRPTKTRRRYTALTRRYMGSQWIEVELTPARRPQDPAPGSAPDTGPGGVGPLPGLYRPTRPPDQPPAFLPGPIPKEWL